MVVFGISGCIRARMLFCGKMVVFGKGDCFRAIWFYSGKGGCIRAKMVDLREIGGFLENGFLRAKVVVFGEKWLYSNKICIF